MLRGVGKMTEQEMIALWGDGTEFGMSPDMVGAMNNAFREVAVRFAQRVAEMEYERGRDDGYSSGYESAFYELGGY